MRVLETRDVLKNATAHKLIARSTSLSDTMRAFSVKAIDFLVEASDRSVLAIIFL